jgi:hypothetical protein
MNTPDPYQQRIAGLTLDTYWQFVIACGWCSGLPHASQSDLYQAFAEMWEAVPSMAFTALATVVFDAECIYDVGPSRSSYFTHILAIADSSNGIFAPTHVHDELTVDATGTTKYRIQFTHAGRDYAHQTAYASDWFDAAGSDLINRALLDNGSQGVLSSFTYR